jgi:DNA-binding transcriptional ArsR family regulator
LGEVKFRRAWNNPRVALLADAVSLFQSCNNNVDADSEEKTVFFRGVWNIVESRVGRPVAMYLLLNGAASARVLMLRTGLGASSVYWALDRLAGLGIVERGIRVRMPNKKCVTIHRLLGCDPELAQEAARLHMRVLHPSYREAERVAQAILEEYLDPRKESEITYRAIVEKAHELIVGSKSHDVVELAAQVLTEKGIRVWR